MTSPRIALIHALKVSMDPIHAAFATDWPEAELVNIWDDALPGDRAKNERITDEITDRIVSLGRHAMKAGADAILYTCSAFGPAIEQAAAELPVPVLKPNEAMFQAALEHGNKVGMVVSFQSSVASMTAEFEEEAARIGKKANLQTLLVTEAMDAVRAGDTATHNRLVAESAKRLAGCDTIMLAQFSMSRALDMVRATVDVPVFTAPNTAVMKLKRLLGTA